MAYLIAGLFLPLFPLSMIHGALFGRLRNRWLRALLLLLWPQVGVLILARSGADVPYEILVWALLTALFYAFRALALREAGLWIGFVSISSWAVLWLSAHAGASAQTLHLQAFGFSAPLALLALITGDVERRFGAAYTGLGTGLAQNAPRLATLWVVAMVAAMATPVFPGFFTLLGAVANGASTSLPTTLVVLCTWLLWTWSGARLIQGLVVGPRASAPVADLGTPATWAYALTLGALALAGIVTVGGLS
ncbi:MAG: proton-conducting transporter membrane subunit [Gammaproteobacteria bacterium]